MNPASQTQNTNIAGRVPYTEFIILCGLLFAQNAVALDVFLPVLPAMGVEFQLADPNAVQDVFTVCFYGFAISQLLYAPISDSIGRRPLLIAGCVVMAIGGLFVILAGSFTALLIARFVQGLGMGAGRTVNLSALRDQFEGRMLGKAVADMYLVFALIPVVAPLIGYALGLWGWRVVASIPLIFSIVLTYWIWKRFPETLPTEKRQPFNLGRILRNFGLALGNRLTFFYALATGCAFASILQILLLATPIGIDLYDSALFGPIILMFSAIAMVVTSFASSSLVIRFGMRFVGHVTLVFMFMCALIFMAALAFFETLSMPVMGFFLVVVCGPLAAVLSNFQAIALTPHDNMAGVAASVTGAMMTFLGTLLSSYFAGRYAGDPWALAVGLVVVFTLSLAIVLWVERGRLMIAAEA